MGVMVVNLSHFIFSFKFLYFICIQKGKESEIVCERGKINSKCVCVGERKRERKGKYPEAIALDEI